MMLSTKAKLFLSFIKVYSFINERILVCFLQVFYSFARFFKGVLGTRFGSLELKIGSLESA